MKYIRTAIGKVGPSLIPNERHQVVTDVWTIDLLKVGVQKPTDLSFNTDVVAVARRLQDAATDATATTDETETTDTATVDEGRNYNCLITYVLGSSTLAGYPGMIISSITHKRDSFLELYVDIDLDNGTGTPMCDPVDFGLQASQTTDTSTTDVTLVYLDAQTDQEKYSVCFTLGEVYEKTPVIMRYDDALFYWVAEGVIDEKNTDTENKKYCQKVSKLGLFAIYPQNDENASRLYSGFILYIMLGIDLFLLIGIILGIKLDKQRM